MTPERWQQVGDLALEVAELSAESREAFLQRRCGEDHELRREVESLLGAPGASTLPDASAPDRETTADEISRGTRIGIWRLDGLLGRGGMGEVHRCERDDGVFHKSAALKLMHPGDTARLQRFETERQILAWMDHPGIAKLFDGGAHGERPYMVMELVEGRNLDVWQREAEPALDQVLEVFAQICAAIAYAHARGVVHRDLKPGNIRIDEQGQAKVLDFGIAAIIEPSAETRTTAAPMTVAYSAPEQIRGRAPRPATDVHALGVILFEMLCGQLPWPASAGKAGALLMQAILDEAPQPPSTIAAAQASPRFAPAELVGDLDAVIMRCLQKPAHERYADAGELGADIARIIAGDEGLTARGPVPAEGAAGAADEAETTSAQHKPVCLLRVAYHTPEGLDAEAFRRAILDQRQQIVQSAARFGGRLAAHERDGTLLAFGYPVARDGAGEAAADCGLELLRLAPFRAAAHAGVILVDSADDDPFSLSPEAAIVSALCDQAQVGELLCSASLQARLRRSFELRPVENSGPLDGESDRHRVLGRHLASSASESSRSPLIGRETDVQRIEARWQEAQDGLGNVVLLCGEPGVGKSRLAEDLWSRVGADRRFRVPCSPLGEQTAYAPIAALLRSTLGLKADSPADECRAALEFRLEAMDVDRDEALSLFAPLLGYPAPSGTAAGALGREGRRLKTHALLRDWLGHLATRSPILVLIEDLHWADPASLDFLGSWRRHLREDTILLLLTTRPEGLPAWAESAGVYRHDLQPLGEAQARQLLDELLDHRGLDARIERMILERAGGIPLFAEELVRDLMESGALQQTAGGLDLSVEAPGFAVPASLQDSIAARIERVGPARELLQLCAVIGRAIPTRLLSLLSTSPTAFESQLARLEGAGMLTRSADGNECGIRHALIADTAYSLLTASNRRELHARVAAGLELRAPELAESEPAMMAHHFHQAGQPRRAADYLSLALDKTAARGQFVETGELGVLAEHIIDALPDDANRGVLELGLRFVPAAYAALSRGYNRPRTRALIERICEIQRGLDDALGTPGVHGLAVAADIYAGDYAAAIERADEVLARHGSDEERALLAAILAQRGYSEICMGALRAGLASTGEALALIASDSGIFESVKDLPQFVVGVTFSRYAHARALEVSGRLDQASDLVQLCIQEAERNGDPSNQCLARIYNLQLLPSLLEPAAVLRHCEATAAAVVEYDYFEKDVLLPYARAFALRELGDLPAARLAIQEALAAREACHDRLFVGEMHAIAASIEARAGDREAAQTCLAQSLAVIEAQRESSAWPRHLLARAEIEALTGQLARAEASCEQAMQSAASEGARLHELEAAMALARMLAARGRRREAEHVLYPVYARFDEGLERPPLRRARQLLRSLAPAASTARELRRQLSPNRWRRRGRLLVMGLAAMARALRQRCVLALTPAHAREARRLHYQSLNARELAHNLGQMKGVMLKLGQMMSINPDQLDPQMRAALDSLQDDVPGMHFDMVREVIRSELGQPLESLFVAFDPEPMAAASIGQVHRARLPDGRPVAVKVQYPGVAEAIRADLATLAPLLPLLRMALPGTDTEAVGRELRERILEELDYRQEARYQQMFFEIFDGHPDIEIPRLHPDRCAERVLTSDLMPGQQLGRFLRAASPDAIQRAAEAIARFCWASHFQFGLMNTDGHPGNYLVRDDGRVAFLDFGNCKAMSPAHAGQYTDYLRAVLAQDPDEVVRTGAAIGFYHCEDLTPKERQRFFEYHSAVNRPLCTPGTFVFTGEQTAEANALLARPQDFFGRDVLKRVAGATPAFSLLTWRSGGSVAAVLTRMQAQLPVSAMIAEYLRGGAPCTTMGERERVFRKRWLEARGLDPTAADTAVDWSAGNGALGGYQIWR